jgi:hypothetical protein
VQAYTVDLWVLPALLLDVIAFIADDLQMDEHAPIGAWLKNKPSASIGLHVLGATKEVR